MKYGLSKFKHFVIGSVLCFLFVPIVKSQNCITKELNLFIGTSNFGTTNPGAQVPHGMMNIAPFNVMLGDSLNVYEKDSRWWSTPYAFENKYFTGFSHVNLSGVGCPDLSGFLLMPTAGDLNLNPNIYGSTTQKEVAHPGFYSVHLNKYDIEAKASASIRTSILKINYNRAQGHLILNLGNALSNESGASCRFLDKQTILGSRLMGNFCYNNNAVFRIYFAMHIDQIAPEYGLYKKQRDRQAEAAWDKNSGKYKTYPFFPQAMTGDLIGAYFSFRNQGPMEVNVRFAVSTVSEDQALKNLMSEQNDLNKSFETIHREAEETWEQTLNVIEIEGGSKDQRSIFYTALYHTLIHPNIANDVDGQYRSMEDLQIRKMPESQSRWTVFSLWDTFRTLHPLYCILSPQKQLDMVKSMLDIYKESGQLPKWELYSRETYTMEGDPAPIMINDTWQRGIRNFDSKLALEAMKRSALDVSNKNSIRPNNSIYDQIGYVPILNEADNSVSQSLEYYFSDFNIAAFAKCIGDEKTYEKLMKRAMNFKQLFSEPDKMFRPKTLDGHFFFPFDPTAGKNFTPNPGYHEGCAWNYAFYVPFAVKQLAKMMGGEKNFVRMLDETFDKNHYDMSNEPDIDNVFLYSYFPKYAYRTQELLPQLLKKYFKNTPDGLPGNDDSGTMSAWAVFSMMGFYPVCAGKPIYALSAPSFDKILIHLDTNYFPHNTLSIETSRESPESIYIDKIYLDDVLYKKGYIISHNELFSAKKIRFVLSNRARKR